ncbi:hypothetical protein DOY81_009781 [Sarcophaga bullata]|nr:hypothetical protein DOY81_009781 [Sarcophaga bullata]
MQPMYDPRSGDDNTLSSSGLKVKRSVSGSGNISMGGGECSHTNTEKRHKRRSKAIKSESEEYDSLNSDSDLSGERIREDNRSTRTDASSQLDNSGYNIHGHSPRTGSSNKERLSVFSRPQLHKNILLNHQKDSTNESLHTSNGAVSGVGNEISSKNPKRPSFKSPKSFFQIIKPTKILTNYSQSTTPACSTNRNLNHSSPEKVTKPKIRIQPKPPHPICTFNSTTYVETTMYTTSNRPDRHHHHPHIVLHRLPSMKPLRPLHHSTTTTTTTSTKNFQ